MARMGHDGGRATIIYQHEAPGADSPITSGLTPTSRPPKPAGTSPATARRKRNSGPLNGPWRSTRGRRAREPRQACPLTWAFASERVTGIEPALSAWEVCGAACLPPGDSATCEDFDYLTASDREYP